MLGLKHREPFDKPKPLPFSFHKKVKKANIYFLTYKKFHTVFFYSYGNYLEFSSIKFQNILLFSPPFSITPSISGGLAECSRIRLPETITSSPINLETQSQCLSWSV